MLDDGQYREAISGLALLGKESFRGGAEASAFHKRIEIQHKKIIKIAGFACFSALFPLTARFTSFRVSSLELKQ